MSKYTRELHRWERIIASLKEKPDGWTKKLCEDYGQTELIISKWFGLRLVRFRLYKTPRYLGDRERMPVLVFDTPKYVDCLNGNDDMRRELIEAAKPLFDALPSGL